MKEIHKANYLLTSIKPENFMIARGKGSNVDRLRWVDLSLLQQCPIDNGLRVLQDSRTRLYASLDAPLHPETYNSSPPSHRDDQESILYLVVEIVICFNAIAQNTTEEYKKNDSFFPWSQEKRLKQSTRTRWLRFRTSTVRSILGAKKRRLKLSTRTRRLRF